MWRFWLAALVLSGSMVLAEEPAVDVTKPQYVRMLQGEDAKRVNELGTKIEELKAGDKSAEAAKHAEELLSLRESL